VNLFTSARQDWETPQNLFDELNAEFNFTLDVCAEMSTAKCPHYFTQSEDGLAQSWAGERCFMNPPYGRQIGAWIEKAYRESLLGALVVCLLPSRTDTKWFHDYIYGKAEVRFLRGRLIFGRNGDFTGRATFPSMIAIYR
jgi:site-specific DNA-methyltransferase (adenine-specific)